MGGSIAISAKAVKLRGSQHFDRAVCKYKQTWYNTNNVAGKSIGHMTRVG